MTQSEGMEFISTPWMLEESSRPLKTYRVIFLPGSACHFIDVDAHSTCEFKGEIALFRNGEPVAFILKENVAGIFVLPEEEA